MTSVTAGTSFQATLRGEDSVYLFIVWSHASSLQLSLGHLGSFLNVSSRIGQYLRHHHPFCDKVFIQDVTQNISFDNESMAIEIKTSADSKFAVAETG